MLAPVPVFVIVPETVGAKLAVLLSSIVRFTA
jgi:hypothetical protein